MVGVEREVLGVLKELREHGAGLYARECRSDAEWMPCPNAKWRLGDPRVKSTRSGLSNWAWSRFPAARNSRTVEPAAMSTRNAAGPLQRLGDELIGDPPRDVGRVRLCRQTEGDVPEAGVERFANRVPRGIRLVVRHVQMDRAGDSGGITAGLGAVAVQQRAAFGGVGGAGGFGGAGDFGAVVPISSSTLCELVLITATASLSAAFGARLKLIVTAGNCVLISSGNAAE